MSAHSSKDDPSLCAFTFSDGRQCRMLRSSRTSKYCFHHERKLRHLRESDKTASDIWEPLAGNFVPATALTHSLTRVFRAVAEGRIDPKSATALARVASTLLKSITASSAEFQECYIEEYWRQLVGDYYVDLPDYTPDDEDDDSEDSDNSGSGSGKNLTDSPTKEGLR